VSLNIKDRETHEAAQFAEALDNAEVLQSNFGDGFSYALVREKREPILFKGHDFGQRDLRSAL